ncbi:MAG: DUF3313 family protein [Xanthomonadales bacterium]
MKSNFLNRGAITAGLLALLWSATALAQSAMQPTWVKDGVDWSHYTKYLVKPLVIDDVQLVPPPWAENPAEWKLEVQNPGMVQQLFDDAIRAELAEDGADVLADAPGPGVLEVEVEILSVTPWLRPGSASQVDGMNVSTLGSGELSATVEMRDAQTRELLAMWAGEPTVGDEYQEFTRENNLNNLEKMFVGFAKRLDAALERVHGK